MSAFDEAGPRLNGKSAAQPARLGEAAASASDVVTATPGAAAQGAAVLIVAHAPLAEAFCALAAHPFAGLPIPPVHAVDVTLDESASAQAVADAVAHLRHHRMVLVLTDATGATPHRLAVQAVADWPNGAVVGGLNLPMLWRSLSHVPDTLQAWAARAAEGGSRGCAQADCD